MPDAPAPLDKDQIPVIAGKPPEPIRVDQIPIMPDPPKPSVTTAEQDRTTQGQRKVNLIWEVTQASIAVAVVIANLIVGVYSGINPDAGEVPDILSNSLFLVIGFYFSRTNHTAIGGLGQKPEQIYMGR